MKFYINGVLDSSHPAYVPTKQENLPLAFGRAASGGNYFHGSMDSIFKRVILSFSEGNAIVANFYFEIIEDIFIFNYELEQDDIRRTMFELPVGGSDDAPYGLIGFWGFDEHIAEEHAIDWGPYAYL